ncbi:30424_t:CDS:1, partial [Gigaspora margarita]
MYIKEDNQKKTSQKKKLLVNNECGIMDYSLEENQLLKVTKNKNIKQVIVKKTNNNLPNTIVEPTITNRKIEMTASQEKHVNIMKKKIEKPIKEKSI